MTQKIAYFDNAAASRLDERVLEAMNPYFFEIYAAATSEFGYSMGTDARDALNKARATLAQKLNANPEEIVFTSGDTESSNMALKGVAAALGVKKGRHLVVSRIEDFPVLHSAKALENLGFKVTYLDVDHDGLVDLNKLWEAVGAQTILVSIQHANQEIGTVQNIESIGRLCRDKGVLFHADATHTFTRLPIDTSKLSIDLLTFSAHTIHGPKGAGGLFVRQGTPMSKWQDGGFQEFNLRAGLENTPAAVGFAKAVELVTPEENTRLQTLRDHLIDRLLQEIPHVSLNGHRHQRIPQNVNVTFHFVEGESLTLHLDMRGFAVNTGSACFSRSLEASHVILGIGGDHEQAHGSLRFSFGRFNMLEEVDAVVGALREIVAQLREISPLGKREKGG